MGSPSEERAASCTPAVQQFLTETTPNDVLLGRGAPLVKFEGNQRFRKLVDERHNLYFSTRTHSTKDNIAREIIQIIKDKNGRFLRKIESEDELKKFGVPKGVEAWLPVDEATQLQKTKQAFRDQANATKNSNKSSKSDSMSESAPNNPKKAAAVSTTLPVQPGNPNFLHQSVASTVFDPFLAYASQSGMDVAAHPRPQELSGAEMNILQQQLLMQAHLRREQEMQREQLLLAQIQRAGFESGSFPGASVNMNPISSMNLLRQAPSSYQNLLLRQGGSNVPQLPQFRDEDILSLLRARDLAVLEGDSTRLIQVRNILDSLQRNSRPNQHLTPLELQLLDTSSRSGMQHRPDLFGFNIQGSNCLDVSDRAVNPGDIGRQTFSGSRHASAVEHREDEKHQEADRKPSRKRKQSDSE